MDQNKYKYLYQNQRGVKKVPAITATIHDIILEYFTDSKNKHRTRKSVSAHGFEPAIFIAAPKGFISSQYIPAVATQTACTAWRSQARSLKHRLGLLSRTDKTFRLHISSICSKC